MSTRSKLNPKIREARAMRSAFVRYARPTNLTKDGLLRSAVLTELALIKRAPHLDGDKKDLLFRRGVKQLSGEK